MSFERLECMTVKSLSVHLSSSAMIFLLRVVRRAAMLMKEGQLHDMPGICIQINGQMPRR